MSERYSIHRAVYGEIVRYTVSWSPYIRMDRFVIRKVIPSEGGIYQVYYKKNRLLHLITTNMAYFGGLRNSIRELIDPISPIQVPYKDFIGEQTCYCRYSESPSMADLQNVLHFFNGSDTQDRRLIEVEEKDTMKILV
jgi:hypothetical protein